MASANKQMPSNMPDDPAPARTAADGLGTPTRSSSGSGDSPFIPAEAVSGAPAVTGQQPDSSGSASMTRSGVEGPERPGGPGGPDGSAADDELLRGEREQGLQTPTAFQEFLEYPSRCHLPQWLNRQFPLWNALKIDHMILRLFMSIQNSFDNRVPRCGHV